MKTAASGGQREFIPPLLAAAAAAGADGFFLETHPDPARALSDSATQWPLDRLAELVGQTLDDLGQGAGMSSIAAEAARRVRPAGARRRRRPDRQRCLHRPGRRRAGRAQTVRHPGRAGADPPSERGPSGRMALGRSSEATALRAAS